MTLKAGVIGTVRIGQNHIRRLTQVLSSAEVVTVDEFERSQPFVRSDKVDAVVYCPWGSKT